MTSLRRRGSDSHAGLLFELTSVEQLRTVMSSLRFAHFESACRARILFAQEPHHMIHDHQVFESWKHEHSHRRVLGRNDRYPACVVALRVDNNPKRPQAGADLGARSDVVLAYAAGEDQRVQTIQLRHITPDPARDSPTEFFYSQSRL